MNLNELVREVPDMELFVKNMPAYAKDRYLIRKVPAGQIIHQKNYELDYFAFICRGDHRVINEFENGNIYMIEQNEAINFIGEVTILAGKEKTSVTLEAVTDCLLLQIPRRDFERWIMEDIELLLYISKKVAFKLYRSSSRNGATLFYPPNFLLLEYLVQYAEKHLIHQKGMVMVPFTRQQLEEELGINIKTLNRTVKKLKDMNLIGIIKGKLTFTREQYERAGTELAVLRKGDNHW